MSLGCAPKKLGFASFCVHSPRNFQTSVYCVQGIRKIALGSKNNAQALPSGDLHTQQLIGVCPLYSAVKELEGIIITALSMFEERQIQKHASFFSLIFQ